MVIAVVVAIAVTIARTMTIGIILDMAVPVIGATVPRLSLMIYETRNLPLDSRHTNTSIQPASEFHEFRVSLQLQRVLLYHECRTFSAVDSRKMDLAGP